MAAGGWTSIQSRGKGDVNFARGMDDYIHGFSDMAGDHWIGLEQIHRLTNINGTTSAVTIYSEDYSTDRHKYL
jgi:ficolin